MKSLSVGTIRRSAVVVIFALVSFWMAVTPCPAAEQVIIFHAGSLTVPLAEIEKRYEAAHPEVDILREGGGSTKMARMISELNKPADIMASADFKVIDKALVPDHADWNIRFASNQLVLCYTPGSRRPTFSGTCPATCRSWWKSKTDSGGAGKRPFRPAASSDTFCLTVRFQGPVFRPAPSSG